MDHRKSITRRMFLTLSAAAGMLARRGSAGSLGRSGYQVFSEGRIGKLRLKNRLVKAATAENACHDGEMTDAGIEIYRDLAHGGVGLIITGAMAVVATGHSNGSFTDIHSDRFVGPIGRIADAVHQTGKGCQIVAQIIHTGTQGPTSELVGPSTKGWPGTTKQPRALTTREVEQIATQFAQAARRVKEGGFDGVEIHGAHGYLLSSFLSPYTNTRTDRYGGSLENRVQIIREIVTQARALVGDSFPILLKMNCDDNVEGGINLDIFPALAKVIEKTGVQAIEASGNNAARGPSEESYFLKYAQRLSLKVPVVLTGGNRSIERLEEIMKTGAVNFFGMARPLIREPDLPNRWLEGRGEDTATCISCNRCLDGFRQGKITRCRVNEPVVGEKAKG
jgi:2,4-dienoyl-CoA reductase-like NADH-dependent reductase (Old Yellow Enzyme family)